MENNNVITNSAEFGLIPQREFFDKDIAVEGNTDKYYIIEQGDFVYNPRKSTSAPYGPFNCYRYTEEGIVSPLYTCLKPLSNEYTDYLLWYFRSTAWHSYIYHNGAQGGARHDRVGMTNDLMDGIPVNLPCIDEQKKISQFLTTLEQRIEKQRQLVEVLKSYKRGVAKRLFSSAAAYAQTVLLKDYAYISTGCSNTQDAIPDGTYPFFIRSQTVARSNRYIFNGEAVLTIGDGQIGKVFHYININGKFDCHQRVYMITQFSQYLNGKYFYHYFSEHFYERAIRMSAKNTVDSVRMEMIEDMPITLPDVKAQDKIADILDSIDSLIGKGELILSNLSLMKQGLLQQLFK